MIQLLHLGDTEVDKTRLAGLCRRYQVRELSLFGSAARGEMRPDSDIDLLPDCRRIRMKGDAELAAGPSLRRWRAIWPRNSAHNESEGP